MQLKVALGSINENESIARKQNVKYDTFDLNKYKEMFYQLVDTNHVYGSFEDIQWELPCNISDYPIIIKFDIEVYQNYNLAIKAYSVIRLLSGRTPITVYNEVALIKKAILECNGLKDLQKLEALLERESQLHSYQGYQIAIDLKRFILFYNTDETEKIIDICNNQQMHKKTSRQLPNFGDVMIFDDVVNDYFQSHPIKQTLEFLPIMLWWLLTNIIPMRPSEFLSLKKNCLEKDENRYSPYRIRIPRIKNNIYEPDSVDIQDIIDIDEKAYNFIRKAIQQLNTIDSDSEYLFPIELLSSFRKTKRSKKNERINRRDFDLLKRDFYEKVVENIYGKYDLERIKSGDTRHFAIINMALQGFNMLSIARMAGHGEIRSQYSYYSHADHFAQSYVYRMAQKRLENRVSNKIESGIIGWKRYVYDKGKTINLREIDLKDIVGRVKFGYCMEEQSVFPNTCIESCKYCSNFAFNPAVNEQKEAMEWLANSSKVLETKIRESIELMRDLSMNLSKSFVQGNDDLLKSTSRNLLTYMDMKTMIDSNLMEVEAFDKK